MYLSRATPRRGPGRTLFVLKPDQHAADRQALLEQPDRDLNDATHNASRHPTVSSRRVGTRRQRAVSDAEGSSERPVTHG